MQSYLSFNRLLLALLLLLLSISSNAQDDIDPQQLVQQTTDQMLAALKANRAALDKDASLIYDLVKEIVLPHFDFVSMSRWVLAKNWRRANKQQKLRFVKAFRTLMVRTYAVALLDYTDQQIKYMPLRDDPASGDVTVRTEVIQNGKQSISINYSLLQKKNTWKVYDIAVDGISLIANYRTSFATEIKQSSLDDLIARLEKHNQKSSAS